MKFTVAPGRILICLLVSLSVSLTLCYAQNGTISGIINDERGEPIIGVNVLIDGTVIGAATNLDGKYIIENLDAGSYRLVVKYISYITQNIDLELNSGENKIIDIELKEDVLALEQVVVVGYGTKVKKNISSAISSIEAKDLENKPVQNFTSAMQGKAPGVQITTDAGVAGAPTTVRIRGTKTLANSAEPLYVVDGVPIYNNDISDAANKAGYNTSPLSLLNPNDIESVEVLKDAAATAIYGSRGANGVVLITTKSGKAGKTKIDINYYGGVSTTTNNLDMLDSAQYMELYLEAWNNDVADGLISPNKPISPPGGVPEDEWTNTNWIDEMLQTGSIHEVSVSASGGNDKTTFFIGGTFRDEKTFLVENKFQRASFRTNLDHRASDKFRFGTNIGITRTGNQYVSSAAAGGLGWAQSTALPIYPIYNTDSTFFQPSSDKNPVAQAKLTELKNFTYRSITNVNAEYEIIKGLTLRGDFGFDWISQFEEFFRPRELTGNADVAEDRKINFFTWNVISTLGYKKKFGEHHNFEVLGGFNPTRTVEKFSYIRGTDFPTDQFTQVQGAATIEEATAGTGKEFSFVSFFTRINYELRNKYLFQFSLRTDGSSRFGQNNKWGAFPALSFGWILSEEGFLKDSETLTFLKLRASIGTSGNAELSDDFIQYSFFSADQNYAGSSGVGPANTSVADLSWETSLKNDLGIDFGFWDNRLSGSVEYFYEYTYDLLIQNRPLPPSSGYSSIPAQNLGKLQNQGFEMHLMSSNLSPRKKVKWKTDLNIALYRNKILDLGGIAEVGGTNFGDNRAVVGEPVGVWMLAEFAGIDPATGEELIYDLQGNKIVANATNTVSERKPIGQPYPKFYGGLNNSISYKGLEVDFLFSFSVGNQIYDDHGKRQNGNIGFGWNQEIRTLERWQQEGDQTDIPKLSINRNRDFNTTRHLYEASYLRLKTLTISYNLPDKVLNKMKIRSCKFFISGQNIFVITPYEGWDPEVNRDKSGAITQGVTYLAPPQSRIFTAGINLGL